MFQWPFIRFFGVQEPASVLFSVLNGLAYLYTLLKLRELVPSTAPMYYLWHFNALVSFEFSLVFTPQPLAARGIVKTMIGWAGGRLMAGGTIFVRNITH